LVDGWLTVQHLIVLLSIGAYVVSGPRASSP
jgi:hypothetical protein